MPMKRGPGEARMLQSYAPPSAAFAQRGALAVADNQGAVYENESGPKPAPSGEQVGGNFRGPDSVGVRKTQY